MKLTGLITVCCMIFGSLALTAQDQHFKLFDFAPITINPANSGNYEGTYRIGGIYRDQWKALNRNGMDRNNDGAFRTPMLYVDAPLLAIGKKGWLGAGFGALADVAGTAQQQTTSFLLSAAYHHEVNRKKNTVMSIGLQGGARNRSFRAFDNFTSEEDIRNPDGTGQIDEATNAFMNDANASDFVINAGVNFRTNIDKRNSVGFGLGVLNINSPTNSAEDPEPNIDGIGVPLRINFTANYATQFTDKWTLQPQIIFSGMQGGNETVLQVWGEYLFNEEKAVDLRFGVGHRLGRDIHPLLGINVGQLRAAVGYDLRMGDLGNNLNSRGGFEVAVGYTGVIFKKPDVPPVIFCPQL